MIIIHCKLFPNLLSHVYNDDNHDNDDFGCVIIPEIWEESSDKKFTYINNIF